MWRNIIARHLESSVAVVDWFDCDAASCGNEVATLDCGALSVAGHSGHAVLFLIRLIEMIHCQVNVWQHALVVSHLSKGA